MKGFGIAMISDEVPSLPIKHPSVLRLTGTDPVVKRKKRSVYLNDRCVAFLKLTTADNRRAGKCFVSPVMKITRKERQRSSSNY